MLGMERNIRGSGLRSERSKDEAVKGNVNGKQEGRGGTREGEKKRGRETRTGEREWKRDEEGRKRGEEK